MKKIDQIVLTLSVVFLLIALLLVSSCNAASPNEDIEASTSGGTEITVIDDDSASESIETTREQKWYYDAMRESTPEMFKVDTGEYPNEIKNVYLIFPLVYETSVDVWDYKIEFARDAVYMHEYAFARVTITNTDDSKNEIFAGIFSVGYFVRDDGAIHLWSHHTGDFSSANDCIVVESGGSYVYEAMFYVDHDFFQPNHSYLFVATDWDPYEYSDGVKLYEIPVSIKVSD